MIKKNGGIFGRSPTFNNVVVEGELTVVTAQTIEGNLTVAGDLTVNGTETVINTQTLNVDDKNIELGAVVAKVGLVSAQDLVIGQYVVYLASTVGIIPGQTVTKTAGTGAFGAGAKVATVDSATQLTLDVAHTAAGGITFDTGAPSDDTANGGGLTLKGATDKLITWVKAKAAWVFSEALEAPDATLTNLTASKALFSDANKKLTSTGTVAVDQGGTGATTLTGYVKGNGTSAMSASASIPNTDITGLGTMSTQEANNVAITGGSVSGLTSADVDNININGNTISSTNTNGNIVIDPNGTGQVNIPATIELNQGVVGKIQFSGTTYRLEGGNTYGDLRAFAPRHRWYSDAGTYWATLNASGIALAAGANFIPASGNGIDFSADSHATGMTSELLDDYEEGTYTATLTPATSGTIPLNSNYDTLAYTKIGRVVHIQGQIQTFNPSSPVGAHFKLSLPFNTASLTELSGRGGFVLNYQNTAIPVSWENGLAYVYIWKDSSTVSNAENLYVDFSYIAG